MKKLTIIYCLLFAQSAIAQKIKATIWADKDPTMLITYPGRTIGTTFMCMVTDNKMQFGFTARMRKVKFGIKLLKYDPLMNLVGENQLAGGERVYGPLPPKIERINGTLYLIYYQFLSDDETSNLSIMAAKIDTASLAISTPKELFVVEQKDLGLFKGYDFLKKCALDIHVSPDSTKTLMIWRTGLKNEFLISVIDQEGKVLLNKKEAPAYTNIVDFQSSCVDNQGNAYISYKIRIEKDEYEGHVLVVRSNSSTLNKLINIKEGHPYALYLVPSKISSLVHIVGTYIGATDYLIGVYKTAINTDNYTLSPITQTEFPVKLIEAFKEDGWAYTKRNHYGLQAIGLEAHELSDGDINMLGEFRSGMFVGRGYIDMYGDLFNIRLGKANPVFSRIPKYRQIAQSTLLGESYFALPYRDAMIAFYNDSEANLKQDMDKSPESSNNHTSLIFTAAIISRDGNVERVRVVDLKHEHFLALPNNISIIDPSSLRVRCEKIGSFGGGKSEYKWALVQVQ